MTTPGWPAAAGEVPWPDTRGESAWPGARRDDRKEASVQEITQAGSSVIDVRFAPQSWRPQPELDAKGAGVELVALRDQLLELGRQRCFVVGITSEQDVAFAKSRVAARLAAMLAENGRARILLLEANFDYPCVHELLSIEMPRASGFSQQMRTRIRSGNRKSWTVVQCSKTLHVLGEGTVRSPGILFSQEFAEAVTELRSCYDVIIADGPVAGAGADHKPVDAVTDGLVVVGDARASLSETLDRAAQWFKRKEFVAAVHADAASSARVAI